VVDEPTEQLRRYGDALERHIGQSEIAVTSIPRQRSRWLLSVAAAIALVAVGAVVALQRHEPRAGQVATDGPASTIPTGSGPTTVSGSISWVGRDARAVLRVAACPESDSELACGSGQTATAADDGTFTLTLPATTSRAWRVAAYVAPRSTCVFNCRFPEAPRNAILGETFTVPAGTVSEAMAFTVTARVLEVSVRDRDGRPFNGGGVQATDVGCSTSDCAGDASMFAMASPIDGSVVLVLHPDVTYVLHGQATNTGWPDPQWTHDGSTFWFSPDLTVKGRELDDGHVFTVEGGPAATTG
jgi:hypothetical protein